MPGNFQVNPQTELEVKNTEVIPDILPQNTQMNAFQLLMDSRNNVIGSNSEGKYKNLNEDFSQENIDKTKQKERKELFTRWAELKGSTIKRKRDMEVEECINIKMEDRIKKFKKLLNSDKNEEDNNENEKIEDKRRKSKRNHDEGSKINKINETNQNQPNIKQRKRKCQKRKKLRKISTSSESSDSNQMNTISINCNSKLIENNPKLIVNDEEGTNTLNSAVGSIDNSISSSNEIQNKENSGLRQTESSKSEESRISDEKLSLDHIRQPEIIDDNAQDILITASPANKSKETSQSNLLNFLGVITKKVSNEFVEILPKSKTDFVKVKMFSNRKSSNSTPESSSIGGQQPTSDNDTSSQENIKRKRKKRRKLIRTDEKLGSSNSYCNDSQIDESNFLDFEVSDNNFRHSKSEDAISSNSLDLTNKSEQMQSSKRILRPRKNNIKYDIYEQLIETSNSKSIIIESSDTENGKLSPIKLAPIFRKKGAKSKVDKSVIEARKRFLVSGIPDSLVKVVEKQKSLEVKLYNSYFPEVSHVQQKCTSKLWNLLQSPLNYMDNSSLAFDVLDLQCVDVIEKKNLQQINFVVNLEKINSTRPILEKIKAEHPEYPVYKVFRHLHEKNDQKHECERLSDSNVYELWTEKYKAQSSEEILGNFNSTSQLKIWLKTWMEFSEKINNRRINENSNSASEFDTSCSEDSVFDRLPGNTLILDGPCGSGKTSAVYAIANELQLNVLELNASNRRTGKKLVQQLQEATQSHQMKKNDIKAIINNCSEKKKNSKINNKIKTKQPKNLVETAVRADKHKMCIVLIEDIDLVFEQDEGFLAALSQFIATSKRPIILTTTDNSPVHVQKFINQHEIITFKPLSMDILGIWLQILCLVEGILIDRLDDVGVLLQFNHGDIRKTLLEVQYWVQSGGQIQRAVTDFVNFNRSKKNDFPDCQMLDEELKIPLDNVSNNNFTHKQCINSFILSSQDQLFPSHMDFNFLWWNIPNILNENNRQLNSTELNLELILNFYDSLLLKENLLKYDFYNHSLAKDSLELSDKHEDICPTIDILQDISSSLINGCFKAYQKSCNYSQYNLNLECPDSKGIRIDENEKNAEKMFRNIIPLSNILDRQSTAIDYFPTLRQIARTEENRAVANTKRSSRFRHYFKDLKMDFNHRLCKTACNSFLVDRDTSS